MADHEKFEELIPLYALGALDGDELRDSERHLKTGCTECEQALKESEDAMSLISYSASAKTPSPKVKQVLFEKIQAKKEAPYSPSFWERLLPVWFRWAAVAVAACLLVFFFTSNLALKDKVAKQEQEINTLKEQIANEAGSSGSLRDELTRKDTEINKLKEQLVRESVLAELVNNPNVIVINLAGLQADSKASGKVLWNKKSNELFLYGSSLPQIPAGKIYQLWVIADNLPKSIGIFSVDEKGNSVIKFESLPVTANIQKFAVTLEPEGGVPQPTGEMYLAGNA